MITSTYVSESLAKIEKLLNSAEKAPVSAPWIDGFRQMNALKSQVQGEASRVSYELSKNLIDSAIEKRDQEIRDTILPPFEEGCFRFTAAFFKSRHRDQVAGIFGKQLVRLLETERPTLDPVNSEARVELRNLSHDYSKILGTGVIQLNGQEMTLSQVRNLQSSPDAVLRKSAYLAWRGWLNDHRSELAAIFDQMVKLRHQMAERLGMKNFIPLGHAGMARTDYGVKEIETFRGAIAQYLVPLVKKIYAQQAKNIGTPTLRAWDVAHDPANSLPSGIAPVNQQLDAAQRVFMKLSPHLTEYFVRMRKEGLIDLEARKNKRPGAFCTSFPDEKKIAIFCNSTGDASDVGTLMHEMGHAFQGWESLHLEVIELQCPTMDAAEIHSMGMEYLSLKHLTEFFSPEHAKTFTRKRFRDAIELICYIAIVDEFQHWVYEHPQASIGERDQAWDRLTDRYLPGVDYAGIENFKSARWYAQSHIFQAPFYYIDYAIAEMGALQLAMVDEKDPARALRAYEELCRLGGSQSVLELFRTVGFRSPFDPSLISDLAEFMERRLNAAS